MELKGKSPHLHAIKHSFNHFPLLLNEQALIFFPSNSVFLGGCYADC